MRGAGLTAPQLADPRACSARRGLTPTTGLSLQLDELGLQAVALNNKRGRNGEHHAGGDRI